MVPILTTSPPKDVGEIVEFGLGGPGAASPANLPFGLIRRRVTFGSTPFAFGTGVCGEHRGRGAGASAEQGRHLRRNIGVSR